MNQKNPWNDRSCTNNSCECQAFKEITETIKFAVKRRSDKLGGVSSVILKLVIMFKQNYVSKEFQQFKFAYWFATKNGAFMHNSQFCFKEK